MVNPSNFFPGFFPPTLITPTQERVNQYLDPSFNYSDHLKNLRQRGPHEGGATQLENIITQCIEGEFQDALESLLRFPEHQIDDFQRIALLRLIGGLFEELGDTNRSQEYLGRALELSNNISAKPSADRVQDEGQSSQHIFTSQRGQLSNLKRFLRREISLDLGAHDLADAAQFRRYEAAREIDAPVFLGYQEYARAIAAGQMFEEEFKASLREEGGVYTRSGFPSELSWLNLSLWMAYTCGDTRRARYTRTNFGRWAVVHGLRGDDSGLLTMGVQELIHSRALGEMEALFFRVGYLIHARLNVNTYFRTFRPLSPSGPAAEPIWRILHMLVKTMAGYADDESLQALRTTYSQGLEQYLAGESGMAVGQTYAVSYFIDAYNEIGPTTDDLERLLVWANEKQYGPGRIHNLWSLVEAYEWKKPEALPLAERTLESLQALYPVGEPEEYPSLFQVLGRNLPSAQRDTLDAWIAEHLPPELQFSYWVNGTHERAKTIIFPMLRTFIAKHTEELRQTQGDSSLSFGGPIVPSYIAVVFSNYREVVADAERIEIINDYLDALANPNIHARFKADGYTFLAEAMRYVSGEVKEAIRRQLTDRMPAQEQSRELERGFFGELGRPIDAQIALWRLRCRAGIASAENEIPFLTMAISDARVRTRRATAEAMAIMLREQAQDEHDRMETRQSVQALLYSRLFDANVWVRRSAITGLIYSGVVLDPLWGPGVLQRARTLVQADQPFVARDILQTLSFHIQELRGNDAVRLLVEAGKVNPHRDVRSAATEAASTLMP